MTEILSMDFLLRLFLYFFECANAEDKVTIKVNLLELYLCGIS
jgi:hypothetical protein